MKSSVATASAKALADLVEPAQIPDDELAARIRQPPGLQRDIHDQLPRTGMCISRAARAQDDGRVAWPAAPEQTERVRDGS
jgi:hypothetical protein